MSRCAPSCTESGYDNLGSGGSSGLGTVDWKGVTLSASSLLQDPQSKISSASYGATSSITIASGDPGVINPGGGSAPDCPIWTWTIDDSFSYTSNSQILVQVKLTGTANDSYFFITGVYNGSDPLSGTQQGLCATIRVDNGNTGTCEMGNAPTNGSAAASIVASGGMLAAAFNVDADLARPRDIMVQSKSNTGPAYGEQSNSTSDPANFSGSKVHGFIAISNIQSGASRAGGTFAGIEIRYAVVPMFT